MRLLIGGDSITATNVPPTVDIGFGYQVNQTPQWQSYLALIARLWPKPVYALTTEPVFVGQFIDIENGAAAIGDFAPYLQARLPHNDSLYLPTGGYMSPYKTAQAVSLANRAGIPRSHYKLLSAHYGAGQHICGPWSCGIGVNVDGTQWIDHGPWDESILLPSFVPSKPSPPTSEFEPMRFVHVNNQQYLLFGDQTAWQINSTAFSEATVSSLGNPQPATALFVSQFHITKVL